MIPAWRGIVTFVLVALTTWPLLDPNVAALAFVTVPEAVIQETAIVGARIQIVWPHDVAGNPATVVTGPLANIATVLGSRDSFQSLDPESDAIAGPAGGSFLPSPCRFEATVRLWSAINNSAARPVATGQKRFATATVLSRFAPARPIIARYPVWDFNDVDVSAARDPLSKVYFFVALEGPARLASTNESDSGRVWGRVRTFSSIWVHGADARTRLPTPPTPTGITNATDTVDTVIRIVWPHDGAGNPTSVVQGTFVNVSVAVFAHETTRSVPSDWTLPVVLSWSFNNGLESPTGITPQKRLVTEGGVTFPVWDFNDVPVPGTADPTNKYHFLARVDGVPTYPAIWTHGADARTYFPRQDVPKESCS